MARHDRLHRPQGNVTVQTHLQFRPCVLCRHCAGDLVSLGTQRTLLTAPLVDHHLHNLGKPGRGNVGAPQNQVAFRDQEYTQGPAPATATDLHGSHVDLVQVRAALPIHFDVDKVLIEIGGDAQIFKDLLLHHMTPVATGVTDGEKNQLVFAFGGGQRLLAPRVPVDRVVGMVQQIGRVLQNQSVGIPGHPLGAPEVGIGAVTGSERHVLADTTLQIHWIGSRPGQGRLLHVDLTARPNDSALLVRGCHGLCRVGHPDRQQHH